MPSAPDAPVDLEALRRLLARGGGRRWWRGLEELADSAAFRRWLDAELPGGIAFAPDRREFLRVMAASLLLAGLPACGRAPPGERVPYLEQPEQLVPNRPLAYATAMLFEGYAQPVLGTTFMGRPTKLEGNPLHPASGGATDAYAQAAVLALYDPDRSRQVLHGGAPAGWGEIEAALAAHAAEYRTGAGLRLLTGNVTSPTLARQIGALGETFPAFRWHSDEPVGAGLRHAGTALVFDAPLDLHYRLAAAEVTVSVEADLLGPGPSQVRHAQDWAAARRAARPDGTPPRLYVAECTPSLTGANADRLHVGACTRMPALLAGLAADLGLTAPPALDPAEQDWVRAATAALRARAPRALVAAGAHLPAAAQALAHRINDALGAAGVTVTYTEAVARRAPDGERSLEVLADDLAAGRVHTLLMVDTNPAYTAPPDLELPALLGRATLRIHAGLYHDETAALCDWHLPLSHPLEQWGDARAVDGTASILQPLLPPLYDSRSPQELLALLLGAPPLDGGYAEVRTTWTGHFGSDGFEEAWRRALHDGLVAGTAAPVVQLVARATEPPALGPAAAGVEVVFRPEPSVWDGRFANNAWLQELPRPLTKLTWDNAVAVSPQLAEELGIGNGEHLEVEAGGRRLTGPAWILPGQAARTVTLQLGYGRTRAGRVGNGLGYDAYHLRTRAAPWLATGATVRRIEGRTTLAGTQLHHTMAGQELVRTVPHPDASALLPEEDHGRPSLYPRWAYDSYAWGMVIDLDLCTGCNACVIACQAENNIPVVGKQEVWRGREMHWLRVDRYYGGELERPQTRFLPVPCMHCEKAPCEVGCPVNATVHGPEGLNQMIYSACIGTRTCSSYCPYKVRRFNFFAYAATDEPTLKAQRNPHVTVRARGVMEKCTYCVQRISAARSEAKREGRAIRDGEVVTACAQACPTRAIVFGDLNDPASAVRRAADSPRNYSLLEGLNTWPRTTYLARIAGGEEND
jgi:MoCo/4Fe-4S cofactor protein with predicted Tat translocation signal